MKKEFEGDRLPFVTSITPTYGRAKFLKQSLERFRLDSYPKNRKEWIIVDSSSPTDLRNERERQEFVEEIEEFPWITYLHIPDRESIDLQILQEYPVEEHIFQSRANYIEEISRLYNRATQGEIPAIKRQFDQHSDPKIGRPSIGEKRNLCCAIAKGSIVIHRDDDDYYGPAYISRTVEEIQNNDADFMRWGDFYVYIEKMNIFGAYKFNSPDGCLRVSPKGETKFLSAAEIQEKRDRGEIRPEGYGYGLFFAYKKEAWRHNRFIPTFTEEDVVLVDSLMNEGCATHFPKGLRDHAVRVIHGNSTESRLYDIFNPNEVPGKLWREVAGQADIPVSLTPRALNMQGTLLSNKLNGKNGNTDFAQPSLQLVAQNL